jgi:hypothetical protein
MTTHTHAQTPLERLRHHVSGAIARGESVPVVEVAGPAKHTQGPWAALMQDPPTIADRRGCRVALSCVLPGQSAEEQQANARLIAAAPDLLEALRGLLRETKAKNPSPKVGKDFSLLVYIEAARKAIARAEGEQ